MSFQKLEEWEAAFARRFLVPGSGERPLYLYIDSQILSEISGLDPHDALNLFINSFKAFHNRGTGSILENAVESATSWCSKFRRGQLGTEVIPDFISLLMLSVLSVTDIESKSVYRRLNDYLELPLTTEQPSGYKQITDIWETWNEWLKSSGSDFGTPTATVWKFYTFQGYSRSQSLIDRANRGIISEYFFEAQLVPGQEIDKSKILGEFKRWLSELGARGEPLFKLTFDSEVKAREVACDILRQVIISEFQRWDGIPSNGRGSRYWRGLIAFNFQDGWQIGIHASDRLIGSSAVIDGMELTIDGSFEFEILKSLEKSEIARWLVSGDKLQFEGGALYAGGKPFYFLNRRLSFEGIVEERSPHLNTQYTVMVRPEKLGEMEKAIIGHGGSFQEFLLETETGFYKSCSVVLKHVLVQDTEDYLFHLKSKAVNSPSLVGGLKLSRGSRPEYLYPWVPVVALPEGVSYADIVIDGNKLQPDAVVRNGQINLRESGFLDNSKEMHSCLVGTVELHFNVKKRKNVRPVSTSKGLLALQNERRGVNEVTKPILRGNDVPSGGLAAKFRFKPHYPVQSIFVLSESGVEDGYKIFALHQKPTFFGTALGLNEDLLDLLSLKSSIANAKTLFILSKKPGQSDSGKVVQIVSFDSVPDGFTSTRTRFHSPTRASAKNIDSLLSCKWISAKGEPLEGSDQELELKEKLRNKRDFPRKNPLPGFSFEHISSGPRGSGLGRDSATIPGNIYDTLLLWISESESGEVGCEDFENAWNYLNEGNYQGSWLDAARSLETLGHIEIDLRFASRTIRVHPPVLNFVDSNAGLAIWSGSRTRQLKSILENGRSNIEKVDEVLSLLTYQEWNQPGGNFSQGPKIIGVLFDPAKYNEIESTLQAIGMNLVQGTFSKIMSFISDIHECDNQGQSRSISPASKSVKKLIRICRTARSGGPDSYQQVWDVPIDDRKAGIYKYDFSVSPTLFAVRWGAESDLKEIEKHWVNYLFANFFEILCEVTKNYKPMPRSYYLSEQEILVVPAFKRLPNSIHNSLVASTGFLPVRSDYGLLYLGVTPSKAKNVAKKIGYNDEIMEFGLEPSRTLTPETRFAELRFHKITSEHMKHFSTITSIEIVAMLGFSNG